MRRFISLIIILLGVAVVSAEKLPEPGETSSNVPALWACHDVIVPLWHEAWPNKDLALMRQLMPKIEENVTALQKAELPGILRDKKDTWAAGVAAMTSASTTLKEALAANREQSALDATEALHSGFERLVRLVRPAMKELDAYHVVLYDLYHKLLPAKDLVKMRGAADELTARCAALQTAPIPSRFAVREARLKPAFAKLCEATAAFKSAVAGNDTAATEKAVEAVHTQYQTTESLFE